jgi:hypothetical protein
MLFSQVGPLSPIPLPRHQAEERKWRMLLTLVCNSKSKTEGKTLPFFDFAYSF